MMPLNVTGYIMKRWPLGGPEHISCSIQGRADQDLTILVSKVDFVLIVGQLTFKAFIYFCCGYTSIVCLLVITLNRFIIIIYRDLYIQVFSKRNVS